MNYEFQEALSYAAHLLAEHRRVHELLSQLERKWSLTCSGPQPQPVIAELREGAVELRAELARHFKEEECGGVLEEAAVRCPDLGCEESRLVAEHPVLLAELDRIIAGTRTSSRVGVLPAELKEAFQQFVKHLQAHEESENRMVEQGFQIEFN